ncbi:MAG: type II toxin-antitoxin system VapC family toxin [Pseudonocardia sp.]|nr:type II toxin-antitoxin system VapC family toxin [Pseudonocardia sp.]
MRALLDTNALLWLLGGDERLGERARSHIESAESLVVSVASLWEVAIKVSIGKLAPIPELHASIRDLGFERLGVEDPHLTTLQTLPLHHRDPFDRLLIAQTLTDGLTVLTADEVFGTYGATIIDARR